MVRTTDVRSFSAFIFELYERAETQDPLALLEWSAGTLARTVHADCAWCGWADHTSEDVQVYGAISHNLPPDYYQYWLTMKDEDLLSQDLVGWRRKVAIYSRQGERQTDGIIGLADRYHLKELSAFVAHDRNSSVSLFLSLYRSGRPTTPMREEETQYVSAALDHVLRASALVDKSMGATTRLIVNERGRILTSSLSAERILREWSPQWKSKLLPDVLTTALSQTRSSHFSRAGLRVERRQIQNIAGPPLFTVTLRRDDREDTLTDRERQIAEKITFGLTHKEIARNLDISPATVRNHTQSVLTKLGARNKAALAAIIASSRNLNQPSWDSP
jgi:DNA-binding CsgD family transcriptional regulator